MRTIIKGMLPDVSVVIPTLNRWGELARRGLLAALAQEGVAVEVIVVDDGSATPAPKSPPFDDQRVRLIRHEANKGVAAARNTGIREARAPWIAFLDDDDMWAPAKLASVVRGVDRAGADFGYSSVLIVNGAMDLLGVSPAVPDGRLRDALREHNAVPAGASNVVVRASLLARSGRFDEEFSALADWEMWIRLAGAGRAEAVSEPLVAYRTPSWVLEDEPRHRQELQWLIAKHPEVRHDWAAYDRWVADSQWGQGQTSPAALRYAAAGLRHRDLGSLARAGKNALPFRRLRDRVRRARLGPMPEWMRLYE